MFWNVFGFFFLNWNSIIIIIIIIIIMVVFFCHPLLHICIKLFNLPKWLLLLRASDRVGRSTMRRSRPRSSHVWMLLLLEVCWRCDCGVEGNIAGVMLVVMVSIIIVNQQPSTDISITAVVAASAAFAASASAAVDSTWMSTSRKESFWGYLMGGSCLACFYPVKSKR